MNVTVQKPKSVALSHLTLRHPVRTRRRDTQHTHTHTTTHTHTHTENTHTPTHTHTRKYTHTHTHAHTHTMHAHRHTGSFPSLPDYEWELGNHQAYRTVQRPASATLSLADKL